MERKQNKENDDEEYEVKKKRLFHINTSLLQNIILEGKDVFC